MQRVLAASSRGAAGVSGCGPEGSSQYKHFLQTGIRNRLHLLLDLLFVQFGTADVIVTVKPAVNTMILTIIRGRQRLFAADWLYSGWKPEMLISRPCLLCRKREDI